MTIQVMLSKFLPYDKFNYIKGLATNVGFISTDGTCYVFGLDTILLNMDFLKEKEILDEKDIETINSTMRFIDKKNINIEFYI